MTFKFKIDKYRNIRGGHSKLLNLLCRICGRNIAAYQKDGPGNLRRLYLDRIISPKKLINLQLKSLKIIPKLKCPSCREDLGTPYIYKKEKRKAFKLYQDALIKKARNLK